MPLKHDNTLWWTCAGLVALVYVLTVPQVWQCEGVDEVEYLGLAHSMIRGHGYTLYGEPYVLYPPLFPSLLSLIMRHDVTAWTWMYRMNALLGVFGWILIGAWMRRALGRTGQWAAWFMLLAYYPWSFPVRFLMSEPLFLPISFGALILAWRILERNRGFRWEYVLLGALSLLAAVTRSASIAFNIPLVLAGATRWVTTRRRAGLAVALLALVLGCGFFAYWSIRADDVNPNAAESHWRWAKKYLGLSKETHGIIATGEEITDISAYLDRRIFFCALRYGQFVTSVVRPPPDFQPLAAFLFLLFLAGLFDHGRTRPWSPMAWYPAVFLAMILMTTWLSNYQRFLLVLAPFLFLFLLQGARVLVSALRSQRGAWLSLIPAAFGIWGLAAGAIHRPSEAAGDIAIYSRVIGGGVMLCYAGLLAIPYFAFRNRIPLYSPWLQRGLAGLLCMAFLHSGTLVGLRARQVAGNETLRSHNLQGALDCGLWMKKNTPSEARCLAAVPRLVAFLADRRFSSPAYDADHRLDAAAAHYVLLTGPLINLPQARPVLEDRLATAILLEEREGRARQCFAADSASVYRLNTAP